MKKITVIIDKKVCEAQPDETLLAVARRNGIDIPTLCHLDGLPGQGCCRVCVVELDEGSGSRLVAACVYRLTGNASVTTNSAKVQRVRGTNLRLLLARAPESKELRALCDSCGVAERPYGVVIHGEKCVLCGLCVRVCAEQGSSAISTVGRGVGKKISTPYDEVSPVCVGCGACASVCPAGAIEMTEKSGVRTIWNKEFSLLSCQVCGKEFATKEELAHIQKRTGASHETLCCAECRQALLAGQINRIVSDGLETS